MTRWSLLAFLLVLDSAPAQTVPAPPPDWTLGPFTRPAEAGGQPIIRPNANSVFNCPMTGRPIHWEAEHTFNPAAVVRDGKVCVLYRAEDDSGKSIGGYTSRLGLATSEDGIHFTSQPAPVLYPDNDDQKEHEWNGGCEDPRCVELEDGSYALFYTQYHRLPNQPRKALLGLAFSKDLAHWIKQGPVTGLDDKGEPVTPRKSASLVCSVKDGRVVATKLNGQYWLYYGEGVIRLLSSPDLKTWTPVPNFSMSPRRNLFDSGLAECGPPALITSRGIVLLYNGKNAKAPGGDPSLVAGVYADGQALFDPHNPAKLLDRTTVPFFQPALPWEKTGQYGAGTTFIEGLVLFHQKWFLYYGCADTFVGVATAPLRPDELTAAP